MKMRFWQKTYILTLAVFLVFLNVGVLSLAMYTYKSNVEAEEGSAVAQQYYVARSFERDYDDLSERQKEEEIITLMEIYGDLYGAQTFLVEFREGESLVYSNFFEKINVTDDHITHRDIRNRRYIIVSTEICQGKFVFSFAKDVEELNEEYRSLMITYITTTLIVFVVLAFFLFALLRKLSDPLDKLRAITEKIGKGDYSVRAKAHGDDEFTLLALSFNSMLEKIEDQMQELSNNAERKQMLVDNMAHELRTPLTSIYGYAQLLEGASISEENKSLAAGYIMSEAKRLEKISEILLDEAYIRGNMPNMTEVSLWAIAGDTVKRLMPKGESCGVSLTYEGEERIVCGNETLLSMLFYNLTENAIKACEKGGKVEIISSGGCVYIHDNGRGMSEDQISHITEPFYRTDRSRSRAEGGAGLGLSLCKRIAEVHGIEMKFTSELGKGTTVTLGFNQQK